MRKVIATQRLYSTKTRIKTRRALYTSAKDGRSQRLYSTKTRIKTFVVFTTQNLFIILRDYIPLKQGLRHLSETYTHKINGLRDYIPLKQGLRPDAVECHALRIVAAQRLYSTKTRIKTSGKRHIVLLFILRSETIFH